MIYIKTRIFIKKILENFLIQILTIFNVKKEISEADSIHKIIIPLFAGIGDTLIFTCCLQSLIDIFPKADITLLTTKRTSGLLNETYPHFQYIHLRSMLNMFSIKHDYDLLISPNRNMRHYLLALWIHPKYMIGYNYSLFIENGESHILRANKILSQLGCHHVNSPTITVSQKRAEQSLQFIKDHNDTSLRNLIAFIIGGRWKSKTYPAEKYRELAEKLIKKYNSDIILLGTDSEIGNDITMGEKKIHNLAGLTTVQEVMGLIHQSRLVIGPDSGLLNMAIAMNKPIVGLFGPVDPHTIVPDKVLNYILYKDNCKLQPCFNEEYQPQCPYEKILCMDFPVEDILIKVDGILSMKNQLVINSNDKV